MQNNRIAVTSLGGSGEEARNCFLVESGARAVLLDCGVRREALGDIGRVYPGLTREIAARLTAVFLSHAHEDHAAALPYLYELGYRGKVYCTQETIRLAGGFMKKWVDYVAAAGGKLPFSAENIDRIDFFPIALGDQTLEGLRVIAGRSGHMLGSCWLWFDFGGKTLLYTGDMTLSGRLLATDLPPEADGAVIDCAYAGRVLSQSCQYGALLSLARQVALAGGKLLLPVPPNGRGSDILLFLCENLPGIPIYAEANVISRCRALLNERQWLRPGAAGHVSATGYISAAGHISAAGVDDDRARGAALAAKGPAVYLTGDGMMSNPVAAAYFEALKGQAQNCVLITGHTAESTLGSRIFDPSFCAENGVAAAAQRLTIKVHLDTEDVLRLNRTVRAKKILLFHAPADRASGLIRQLAALGAEACCSLKPRSLEL